MRPVPRIALTLLVAAGSLVAAAAVALRPSAVERRVKDLLASALRAPTEFETARFSIHDGLVVQGLVVLDPHDPLAPPLVRIETARIDLQFGEPGKLVHVDGIRITGLHLRAHRRADGTLRLTEILRETSNPGGPLPPLVVEGGTLTYSDDGLFEPGVAVEVAIDRVTFAPTDRAGDLPRTERRELTLAGRSDATGELEVRALLLSPGRVDVTANAGHVDLGCPLVQGLAGDAGERVREHQPDGSVEVQRLELVLGDEPEPVAGTFVVREGAFSIRLPDASEPLRIDELRGTFELAEGTLSVADTDAARVEARLVEASGRPARLALWGEVAGVTGGADPRLGLHARARGLSLRPRLHARLPADVVAFFEEFEITGRCDLEASATGNADAPDVTAEAELRDATFNYVGIPAGPGGELDGFPWKVDVSRGTVHYDDGELTYDATATRGKARVVSTGTVRWNDTLETETLIDITGHDVPLDDDLRAAFGSSARDSYDPYRPTGEAEEIRVRIRRLFAVKPLETVAEYDIVLDGRAGFTPRAFPVPLERAQGEIRIRHPRTANGRTMEARLHDVTVAGDGFTLAIDAVLREDGDRAKERYHLSAEIADLAGAAKEGTLAAPDVEEEIKEIVRAMEPRGAASFELIGDVDGDRVVLDLKGASMRGWKDLPVSLADVRGVVRFTEARIDLEQLRARGLGTAIRCDGHLENVGGEQRAQLELAAEELPLGASLRKALGTLADEVADVWAGVDPGDDALADAYLSLRPSGDHRLELRNVRGGFAPFGLPVVVAAGELVFEDGVANLSADAQLGHAVGRVERLVANTETGDFSCIVDFKGLHFPEDLASILPEQEIREILDSARARTVHGRGLQLTARSRERDMEVEGELDVRPRTRVPGRADALEVEGIVDLQPLRLTQDADGEGADLSGRVHFRDLRLRAGVNVDDLMAEAEVSGRFATDARSIRFDLSNASFLSLGRTVTAASLRLQFDEDALRIRRFDGRVASGRVTGRLTAGDTASGSYRGLLRLTEVQAAEFFHATRDERIEGVLGGEVRFESRDGRDESLTGSGGFKLRDGRFLNVPVFATTLARWKDVFGGSGDANSDQFEYVKLDFDLEGPWLRMREFVMKSPSVEVTSGRGRIGLDGRLDFRVRPHIQAGLIGFDDIIQLVQRFTLGGLLGLELRVTGTLRNPRVEWQTHLSGSDESTPDSEPDPTTDLHPRKRDPW